MRFPRPAADLLGESLNGSVLAERLRDAEIWRIWPDVVGPAIAPRARPLRIINGVLTVAVSSGPWMQELRFLSGMLKQKLNDRLGSMVVSDILFKSGRVEQDAVMEPPPPPPKKRITPRLKGFIEDQAAAISDRDTREAFMALMKASLETVRS